MKASLKILIIIGLLCCASCSTRLYKVDRSYVQHIKELKEFDITDFSVYVFNICERFDREVDYLERFCDCPNDFYKLTQRDSIKKIEEVYLLINEEAQLAVYLTTLSHKYISNKRKGFLNDSSKYRKKVNLNQIEYAYVGSLDRKRDNIDFPHPGKEEDIGLHFERSQWASSILIDKVRIPTAENAYTTEEPIDLREVFSNRLHYVKSDYKVIYFQKDIPRTVEKLVFTEKKGKLDLLFTFSDYEEKVYKIDSKRLRYQLDYGDIDTVSARTRKGYKQ